jgi:ATP-dependent Lon protease
VEQFVVTAELQSGETIGSDPLPPGQVWVISPGSQDEGSGLFRIDVNESPGSGVKVINRPIPAPFQESIRCAEQNLLARARELVGDREPRQHEFIVQLRAFDAARDGAQVGVGALLALASSLLQKSLKGGLIVVGGITLGGSLEPIYNAVDVVELAAEKGADTVLMPVSARKQLLELSDDLATRVNVLFYGDAKEALVKGLLE